LFSFQIQRGYSLLQKISTTLEEKKKIVATSSDAGSGATAALASGGQSKEDLWKEAAAKGERVRLDKLIEDGTCVRHLFSLRQQLTILTPSLLPSFSTPRPLLPASPPPLCPTGTKEFYTGQTAIDHLP
jgi:hypothetical protein